MEVDRENEKDTDNLVKLIINAGALVHSWLRLLVTLEAGMIVILGFILRPPYKTTVMFEPKLGLAIGLGVPFFGAIFALAICCIIVRERKWVSWYVKRLKDKSLSPTIMPPDGAIRSEKWGTTSLVITILVILIVLGWVGIVVFLKPWCLLST